MTDIDAAITARQFAEAVPQHEADTKRKKDTPRSAINAYKRKQAAIDEDAKTDASTQNSFQGNARSYGMPMNVPGTDKPRQRNGFHEPEWDSEGNEIDGEWIDTTEEPGGGPVGIAFNTLHNENVRAARRLGTESRDRATGEFGGGRPDVSYILAEKKLKNPDIDARMSAWHDASQHPERAGEFLRGYHIVNDKAVDAVKDSISPNGEIKESANETDPKEFMPAMADAAAEDAMDDFEAQGVKHMLDTKKDRAAAVTPVVKDKDKVRGAEAAGRYAEYNDKFTPTNATLMDIDVDTSSYLEGLMDKGLITPEEYVRARVAFRDGRARGRQDVAEEIAENQPRDY